jgi:hypothetical protein
VAEKDSITIPERVTSPMPGWTFETMASFFTQKIDTVRALLEANDRRYLEMFQASEKATGIAMTASEKAVAAALSAAKEAVSAALAASDRAVQKAEENQLRVNVGQNEFRGQLRDQAVTFATKEAMEALDRRVQTMEKNDSSGVTRPEHDALLARVQSIEKLDQTLITRDVFDARALAHAEDDKRAHAEEDRRISALEQSRASISGSAAQQHDDRSQGNWKLGVVISIVAAMTGWAIALYALFHK